MTGRPSTDTPFMRLALRLARRAYGFTSPNPLVGAVMVKRGRVIGRGWHRRAGEPHAEIEALRHAAEHGHSTKGATLYVTLEPCCTHGRTPPCTGAIIAARIKRVVVAATDPNPVHAGRGFDVLREAGIEVERGVLADDATLLNETFNHWVVHHMPFVTVKAAMTLDGKIATASGESKWITGQESRAHTMHLRRGADAILVGVNTVLADDPSLTVRKGGLEVSEQWPVISGQKLERSGEPVMKSIRRLVLDSQARTPLSATLVNDALADTTTIFVGKDAPARQAAALARRVKVVEVPRRGGRLDLRWILRRLGAEGVTSLLVEGGGEVNASFLEQDLLHRVAFFYAPKILGGRDARRAVAGEGFDGWPSIARLRDVHWKRFGADLFLTARIG